MGTPIRDVGGAWIVPGFIDTHDHIATVRRDVLGLKDWGLEARLAYGVTTSFDPSTLTIDMLAYQDLLDAGLMTGPPSAPDGCSAVLHATLRLAGRCPRGRASIPRRLSATEHQGIPCWEPPRSRVGGAGVPGIGYAAHHRRRAGDEARPVADHRRLRGQRARSGRVPTPGRRLGPAHRDAHELHDDASDHERRPSRRRLVHRRRRSVRRCQGPPVLAAVRDRSGAAEAVLAAPARVPLPPRSPATPRRCDAPAAWSGSAHTARRPASAFTWKWRSTRWAA